MKKKTTIKLVIADDHEIFRDGLAGVFEDYEFFEVLDKCKDGEHLLRSVKAHQPDIVLTDLKMPVISGVEAIAKISADFPAVRCLVLSNFDNEYLIVEALNAGAMGYITKSSPKKELFGAIEQVYRGEEYYCSTTSKKLMRLALHNVHPRNKVKAGMFSDLEKNIIRLICEDNTCVEIGVILHMSDRTVENYRGRIFKKMNVTTLAGVAVFAVRHSLYFVSE